MSVNKSIQCQQPPLYILGKFQKRLPIDNASPFKGHMFLVIVDAIKSLYLR